MHKKFVVHEFAGAEQKHIFRDLFGGAFARGEQLFGFGQEQREFRGDRDGGDCGDHGGVVHDHAPRAPRHETDDRQRHHQDAGKKSAPRASSMKSRDAPTRAAATANAAVMAMRGRVWRAT
ncbi:MAG: hypothetical protein M5R36_15080 [Deltaproteobacteria bacterium]|nr:hypothetical protein [Deltaproteobacteria bacterium]